MSRGRIEGLVLLALALAYWRGAYHVPPFGVSDAVGPSGFPTLLGGVLSVAGLVLVVRGDPTEQPSSGRPLHVAAVFAFLAIYALVFTGLGFLLATFLFLVGAIALFAPAWKWRIPAFAALLTITLHLLFSWGLGVMLPRGPLRF